MPVLSRSSSPFLFFFSFLPIAGHQPAYPGIPMMLSHSAFDFGPESPGEATPGLLRIVECFLQKRYTAFSCTGQHHAPSSSFCRVPLISISVKYLRNISYCILYSSSATYCVSYGLHLAAHTCNAPGIPKWLPAFLLLTFSRKLHIYS